MPNTMVRKMSCALLSVLLVCLTVSAQKEPEYRAGRLLKVSNQSYVMPGSAGKTAYLLHIQDGSNDYFALYSVNDVFGHDRSNQLKSDSEIQYRISGKNLFLKAQDSKEIKSRLCTRVQIAGSPAVKCGDMVVFDAK
jgi:hypothetical protein